MKNTIYLIITSLASILLMLAGKFEPAPAPVFAGTEITWEINRAKCVRSVVFEVVESVSETHPIW